MDAYVGPQASSELPGAVFEAELEAIRRRRRRQSLPGTDFTDDPENRKRPSARHRLVGLALSGGGIRSASFNLGVLQALDRHGYLDRVDYLSTVSGGGYIGCCLSSAFACARDVRIDRIRITGVEEGADGSLHLGRDDHGRVEKSSDETLGGTRIDAIRFDDPRRDAPLEVTVPENGVWNTAVRAVARLDTGDPTRPPLEHDLAVIRSSGAVRGLQIDPEGNKTQPHQRIRGRPSDRATIGLRIRSQLPFPFRHEQGREESAAFRHLRDNANYLLPRTPLASLRIPGLFLRGITVNLISILPFLLVFAWATAWWFGPAIRAAIGTVVFPITVPEPEPGAADRVRTATVALPTITWHFRDYGIDLAEAPPGVRAFDRRGGAPVPSPDDRAVDMAISPSVPAGTTFDVAVWEGRENANPIFVLHHIESFRLTLWGAAIFAGVLALYPAVLAIRHIVALRGRIAARPSREISDRFTRYLLGGGLAVIGALFFIELQPLLIYSVERYSQKAGFAKILADSGQVVTVAVSTVTAILAMFSGRMAQGSNRLLNRLGLFAIGLLAPLSLWLIYITLTRWLLFPGGAPAFIRPWITRSVMPVGLPELADRWWPYLAAAAILYAFTKVFYDVNKTSFHRFYRDSLSRTFLFDPWRWQPDAPGAALRSNDCQKLGELNTDLSPYHIINTTLNVQGAGDNLRGRNGDFFVFTPRYIGGQLTGYAPTKEMETLDPYLDLGSALAISGAAAAPNMGRSTVRPLTFLMALMNIRLGYWLPNPWLLSPSHRTWARHPMSILLSQVGPSYLLREMAGWINSRSRNIHLTDGGHLENLGLYELVRRRCKYIIVSDATADAEMSFSDLAHAIRLIQIDMGIKIDVRLDFLVCAGEKRLSGVHCAIGTIHYTDDETGELLYIKSSVTGDENVYVSEYRARYALFPHETTLDQFFDEAQFETYRSLGMHVGERLFEGHHDRRLKTLFEEMGKTAPQGEPPLYAKRWLDEVGGGRSDLGARAAE